MVYASIGLFPGHKRDKKRSNVHNSNIKTGGKKCFLLHWLLAAASLIVMLVCRSNRGTVCSKALKKEIKTALLLLEKRLYLLKTQEAAPSLAHTVAQLCRERVRVCDSASAAVRRAQNEGIRLSGALWRRVYGACREFLRKGAENDELALLLGRAAFPHMHFVPCRYVCPLQQRSC